MSKHNTKLATLLIKPNFIIAAAIQTLSLCDHIVDQIGTVPNLMSLKLDPDFICYICSKIENEMKTNPDNKSKTNSKLVTFWEIYTKLFGDVSDADKVTINAMIEFMIKNGHVLKVSLSRVAAYYLKKKLNL